MDSKKCYLDTSFISVLIRKNFPDMFQIQAILRIHSFWKQGYIQCFTSESVKKELQKTPAKYSDQHSEYVKLYILLDKAEMYPTIKSIAGWGETLWGEASWGGGVDKEDPIFFKLRSIFDRDDAIHIFLCIKNNIPYFLTCDFHTILNRVKQHRKEIDLLGIQILSPKEFEDNLY